MTQKNKTKAHSKLPFLLIIFLLVAGLVVSRYYDQISSSLGVKGAPKAEAEVQNIQIPDAKDEFLGPYEEELEDYLMDEVNKEIVQTLEEKIIKKYRLHLVNLAKLSGKFLENKDYSNEVGFLLKNRADYSPAVVKSLERLYAYNKKYQNANIPEYVKLGKKSRGWLKKIFGSIFDVMSENPEYRTMIEERDALKEDIKNVQLFIYSPEFLKRHINYD